MEDIENLKDQLCLLLKERKSEEAKQLLLEHPELTNSTLTDEYKQELTTPLLEACRVGECTLSVP